MPIDTVALSIAMVFSLLATYRSFSVRQFLPSPLYRRRALWTGAIGLISVGELANHYMVDYGLLPSGIGTPLPGGNLIEFLTLNFFLLSALLVFFLWIDSTIQVALDLDLLNRDSIYWKKFRRYVGALWVLGLVFGVVFLPALTQWEYFVLIPLFVILTAYLAAVVIVSGSRVRDATMRTYVKWVGLLLVAFFFGAITYVVSVYLNFPQVFAGYFLYRAASSLSKTVPSEVELRSPIGVVQQTGP